MESYLIKHLPDTVGAMPLSGEFTPDAIPSPWAGLVEARLADNPTNLPYFPDARARVGWNASGIHVLMYALEPVIKAVETKTCGLVYQDSCLEFFLSPNADSLKYVNCELNPMNVMHLAVGENRFDRVRFYTVPDGFDPSHSDHRGAWWAVSYTIPAGFISEHLNAALCSGKPVRGNFMACGEPAHYNMFKGYFNLEKIDFHRPDLFADMMLE